MVASYGNWWVILPFFLCNFQIKLTGAVIAKPSYFSVVQPNKEIIQLKLQGDDSLHWLVDEDGNTVVRTERHSFEYAKGLDASGKLAPSGVLVGKDGARRLAAAGAGGGAGAGAGAKKRPRASAAARAGRGGGGGRGLKLRGAPGGGAEGGAAAGGPPPPPPPRRGRGLDDGAATLKNLVVPILFADHADRALPSQDDLDQLWNAAGGHPDWAAFANQSVKEFYYEQSYGNLALESTVLGWIEIGSTEAECANGDSGTGNAWMDCLRDALETADASVDFGDYDEDGDGYIDAIAFMHSGYGAEYGGYDDYGAYYTDRIWSHKWAIFDADSWAWDPFESEEGVLVYEYHVETALYGTEGSGVTSIGVAAHETGHFLGLPDLYDTDYSSAGIDTWGIMSNSWGWDGTGGTPPSFCAWSKYALGWVEPTELEDSGVYTINDVQTNSDIYMVSNPFPDGEYLLIENRQAKGADKDSPQGGLLVWHIDEYWSGNTFEGYNGQNGWPENGYHYLTALLQADGLFELEQGGGADAQDVFHAGGVAALAADPGAHPSSMAYQAGNVYETGFAISNVSASTDGMTFHCVVGNVSHANYTESTTGLTLEMFDSWGDGWNGNYMGLFTMGDESAGPVSTHTLFMGSEGEAKVAVANSTCYSFHMNPPPGGWGSEVSWNVPACGINGTIYTTSYFCIDDVGNCAEYIHDCNMTVDLYDSWGDGWSGNLFGLFDQEDSSSVQNVTMYSGFSATECLSIEPSRCYTFELAKAGYYQDEIFWSINNGLMEGDSFADYSFCIGDDWNVTVQTPKGLDLQMFDSWGDGWSGTYMSVRSLDDPSTVLDQFTLYSGSYGEEIVEVANDTCYVFHNQFPLGWWASEVSWALCGINGSATTTGYFCIDAVGGCAEYTHDDCTMTVEMFDSWGDGWNGNTYSLYEDGKDDPIQAITLHGGFSGVECLNVSASTCYQFTLTSETYYASEISWTLDGEAVETSQTQSLRFCLDDAGAITIKYPKGIEVAMYDSWGDGWNGNTFGLYSMDDPSADAIQTVTLLEGSEDVATVVVQNSTCYIWRIETVGWYTSEVSWEICGIEGDYATTAYFCIDDVGSCSEYIHDCDLKIELMDSWGDGWNGNRLGLYDDASDELVQEVTLHGGFSGVECLDVALDDCYYLQLSHEAGWPEELSWTVEGVAEGAGAWTEAAFCYDGSLASSSDGSGTTEEDVEYYVEIQMCLVVSADGMSAAAASTAVQSAITAFLYATDGLSGGETLVLTLAQADNGGGGGCDARRRRRRLASAATGSSSTGAPSTLDLPTEDATATASEYDGTLAYDVSIKVTMGSEAQAEAVAEAFEEEVDAGGLDEAFSEEGVTVEEMSVSAEVLARGGEGSSDSSSTTPTTTDQTLTEEDSASRRLPAAGGPLGGRWASAATAGVAALLLLLS